MRQRVRRRRGDGTLTDGAGISRNEGDARSRRNQGGGGRALKITGRTAVVAGFGQDSDRVMRVVLLGSTSGAGVRGPCHGQNGEIQEQNPAAGFSASSTE